MNTKTSEAYKISKNAFGNCVYLTDLMTIIQFSTDVRNEGKMSLFDSRGHAG
jgi:hypothetical protein